MPEQRIETDEFITLIERIRDAEVGWCLRDDLQLRARELSALILRDAVAASRVPLEIWVVFIGLQPYDDSLNTLADLNEVIPQSLKKITEIDSPTALLRHARDVILERLNILTRRQIHSELFDRTRLKRIDALLKKMSK